MVKREVILSVALAASALARQPLVVISVDGLDNRYLQHADKIGLKIPALRPLMREGQFSRGVIGVVPTVTWPSHTTLITGADPVAHGILGNQKPKSEAVIITGARLSLKSRPCCGRRGGSMDLRSIESKAKPADLVEKIEAAYPSFAQEWMDDRTRTLAAIYLLRRAYPDLLLVHFVDLDSEEHDDGPFSREANAVLERTDELIGQVLAAMPEGKVAADPQYGVGREIPRAERERFRSSLPPAAAALFESAEGFMFWNTPNGEIFSKPSEIGNDGHWPMRYRAVYVLWGRGIPHEELPEFSMKSIAGRLAKVIGVEFASAASLP